MFKRRNVADPSSGLNNSELETLLTTNHISQVSCVAICRGKIQKMQKMIIARYLE